MNILVFSDSHGNTARMAEVGRSLPHTLRETGKGGLAATPFGMEYAPKD